MARWNPPSNVGNNEQIGRRLFEEPILRGFSDQPQFAGIRLNHFEETRGSEVSLDRLGATGLDRKVIGYLTPRAQAAGRTFGKPKDFDGWIVVPAKELVSAKRSPSLPVLASPVPGDEPKDNLYHAHVVRPETHDAYMMALHLKHIFTTYGTVYAVGSPTPPIWMDRVLRIPGVGWIARKLLRKTK
jgi:hypothetical protein